MARPNPRNANGHRRRQLRARVLTEEDHCALCGRPVDTTLPPRLPASPEVDEDIPVSRGGNPYSRTNTALMHRACNNWKADRTLAEARAALNAANQTGNSKTQLAPAPVTHSNTW